jgi:nucleotide-binding universal stress UspA family protein
MSQHADTTEPEAGPRPVAPTTTGGVGRVVVGVDGSRANASALAWAVREARVHALPLLLVAVGSGDPETHSRRPDLEADHRRHVTENLLDDLRSLVRAQVEHVSTRAEVGEPSHGLLRAVSEGDLMVVGKRSSGALARAVIGSTAVAVAGRCDVPVVVVPADWSTVEHSSGPVVAGFDGTERDAAVLDFAFARAARDRVPLVVVCAWQVPAVYAWSPEDRERWAETARTQLHDALLPWTLSHPAVETTVETGSGWHDKDPADTLLDAVPGAQLVVLGRHTGPHHLGGLAFGSTSRKVLHQACVPVAVVPATAVPQAESFDEGDSPEF